MKEQGSGKGNRSYSTYKTYSEEALLPLSALQHYIFCKRQCALIHIEQVWSENLFTAEGRLLHEHVDSSGDIRRGKVHVEYSVPIRSYKLGLIGKADVVEFHQVENTLRPFPVEYKRGRPKVDLSDRIQLCAQAICLEEMMNLKIHSGAIFYGRTRRRYDVVFDHKLRHETEETARQVHQLLAAGKTPKPEAGKKCKTCSLKSLCMPDISGKQRKGTNYLLKAVDS